MWCHYNEVFLLANLLFVAMSVTIRKTISTIQVQMCDLNSVQLKIKAFMNRKTKTTCTVYHFKRVLHG